MKRFGAIVRTGSIALLTLVVLSCGNNSPPDLSANDAGANAKPVIDAGIAPVDIELGTGQYGFTEVTDDVELPLVLGPQGTGRLNGYHVWGAVRTSQLDASERVNLKFSITRKSDGALMAMSEWAKKLQPSAKGDEFYALTIILSDCCEARGEAHRLWVIAEDVHGKTVSTSVDFRAGGKCGDADDREICP
jgi:hypothetical protein